MTLNTCSEIISYVKKLESESAKFYQDLSEKFPEDRDIFISFAEENQKSIVAIERAYYGVITDAIECCFAFNINPDKYRYTFETEVTKKASYVDALVMALEMEEKIIKFYSRAVEQSKSLMADVPRAFTMVAKKRNSREMKLRSLLNKVKTLNVTISRYDKSS